MDTKVKEVCAVCNVGTMNLRAGRFGHFMGCSKYPECKNTYVPGFAKPSNDALKSQAYKKEHRKQTGNTWKG